MKRSRTRGRFSRFFGPEIGFIAGLFVASLSPAEAFTYHWEIDETPQGSDRVTRVEPVRVLLADQVLDIASHSASLQLMKKYSVHLGEEWSSGHAYSLLRTFESIPLKTDSPFYNKPVLPSIWRLTHEHVQDDISVDLQDGQRIVTIAQAAFVHSEPLLAEIEGVRGRFFSKRLHEAVVRFVTNGGADRAALKWILQERYGVSLEVRDFTELTRHTTGETASRFSAFKNEELMFLASMLEEYPEGLRRTPGLGYIVRRLDGTPHPLYPEVPAVAWPTALGEKPGKIGGYIEFMESAFQEQGGAYIHRLILHEKAHFLWEHLFDYQLKADWIELGGWYENPDDKNGWSTTRQLEFVSDYAHKKNPDEDMAESISYYIVTPDKLRSRSPAKYEFIQNRIMHGVRYISQIRKDLTFQVYNLYPDLVYPGRIIRVDIQVEGEPEADKRITIELEIHQSGEGDKAQASHLRVSNSKGAFFDLWLSPVDENGRRTESGHILRGQTELSRYAAHGYWAPDQITLSDAQGNERHESQTDFGWQLYLDNPLADYEAPVYIGNSMRLSLSEAMENGRRYQILTARWKLFEENGIKGVLAHVNDDISRTYSRSSWGDFDSQTGEASVDLAIPDYFPGGLYAINYILMEDIALNRRGVYFTDTQNMALRPSEDVVLDEAPATIEIQTTTSDITPPELDLNRITIQAEPTRPEDPNGETLVDITFRVRDNISGYHYAHLYLRDPQGGSHFFRHYPPDFYNVYFQGDPTVYQTYFKSVTLPVGSIPGIWGLAGMNVYDKAENILWSDFTEIVRFEVIDPDSQVTVFAIPQALQKVSGDEQEGLAGEALSAPFVVSVLDQNNGAYLGAPVTFMISGGQGTLSVETTATDSAGQAATTLTLGGEPGINTVDAVVAGLLPVTFTARGIGIPDNLTKVSGRDQQGPAGGALADPFVVRVQDLNGNPLAGVPVTFAVSAGGGTLSGGQGTLSVETTATDSAGQAATTLTLGGELARNTVTARVGDLKPVIFSAQAIVDFDGDGETGFSDFFLFADAFGGSDPRFDLDGSGSVDFADFFLFADSFAARGKLLALARQWIGLPDGPQLQQNAPNPFNSQTVITWFQPQPGPARLEVFSLTGQRVAVLHQGSRMAGVHRVHWDGRDDQGRALASGVYLCRLATDDRRIQTRKLTLLR